MKLHTLLLLAFTMPLFAQYTAPEDDELAALANDSEALAEVLADASGAEAAALVIRLIAFIDASDDFDAIAKDTLISEVATTGAAVLGSSEQRVIYARELIRSIPDDTPTNKPNVPRKRLVMASISLGSGEDTDVMQVLIDETDTEPESIEAVTNPVSTIEDVLDTEAPPPPPPGTNPPEAPPTAGDEDIPPNPPPVPEPYDGQG